MRIIEISVILVILGLLICWPFNLYKLISSDWDDNSYKQEVIHAIGVFVPFVAPVTVWYSK